MSSVSSTSENWMWMAFLRMAEPLIKKVDAVTSEPGADRMVGFATEAVAYTPFEEDGERWDGLS